MHNDRGNYLAGEGYTLHQQVCLNERRERVILKFSEEQHDMVRASTLSEPITFIPQYVFKRSSSSSVVMVQPTQDRQCYHLTTTIFWWNRRSKWLRDLLFDALMRSHVIKVLHVGLEHAIHVFLMEDKDVIKTFAAYAPQKAFTDGIGTRCMIWGLEELDGACRGHSCESWSEFAIVIVNEVSGYLPIWGSLP